jgi:hypothetical protein
MYNVHHCNGMKNETSLYDQPAGIFVLSLSCVSSSCAAVWLCDFPFVGDSVLWKQDRVASTATLELGYEQSR